MDNYPMVRVRWLDAHSHTPSGWNIVDKLPDIEKVRFDCVTVGFLIDENKELLRIAMTITDDNHPKVVLDILVIPRPAVVKIEYLTVKPG